MENFTIKEPREYSETIRMLESTDPNHADTFNVLFEQLINNDAFLKKMIEAMQKVVAEFVASKGKSNGVASLDDEGKVPKEQIELTANDVGAFSSIEGDKLKKSVSDGKKLVADAVTAKGIRTATDAAFATIATNISQITTGVDTSDANAEPEQILAGKTAYVNGNKITGIMKNNDNLGTTILKAGEIYDIPSGYSAGGRILAANLASQTEANAVSNEILAGKTAWVNGEMLIGTYKNAIKDRKTIINTLTATNQTISLTLGEVFPDLILKYIGSTSSNYGKIYAVYCHTNIPKLGDDIWVLLSLRGSYTLITTRKVNISSYPWLELINSEAYCVTQSEVKFYTTGASTFSSNDFDLSKLTVQVAKLKETHTKFPYSVKSEYLILQNF